MWRYIMKTLQKLFPLSFKYSKSVKSIIGGAMIYFLLSIAVSLVVSLLIEPMVSTLVSTLLSVLYVIPVAVMVIGWFLTLVLGAATAGVGAVLGLVLVYVGLFLLIPVLAIESFVVSTLIAVPTFLFNAYVFVGITVSVLNYAGVLKDNGESEEQAQVAEIAPVEEAPAKEEPVAEAAEEEK